MMGAAVWIMVVIVIVSVIMIMTVPVSLTLIHIRPPEQIVRDSIGIAVQRSAIGTDAGNDMVII